MLEASALVPIPTIRVVFSVRIGHVPVTEKPRIYRRVKKCLPAGANYAHVPFSFGLFESVIDRYWKGQMRL